MPRLIADGLTKQFGPVTAVSDLSFTAEPGRVTAFLGPNGSGKTTTLRMLVGLADPTSGTATIDGLAYKQLPQPYHTVGVLLDGGFHPGRRAKDHLRILAAANGVDSGTIDQVLEFAEIGYAAKRRVGGFSTGMKQRLALAAAMLTNPPVLILDEPLNGLDPEGIQWLRGLLRHFADEGRTVLLSSHVLAETEQIADDVVIISGGLLKAAASMDELAERVTPAVRVRTPQPSEARALLVDADLSVADSEDDDGFVVEATSDRVGEILGRNGIILHELVPQKQRLEALYFEMVGVPPAPPAGAMMNGTPMPAPMAPPGSPPPMSPPTAPPVSPPTAPPTSPPVAPPTAGADIGMIEETK